MKKIIVTACMALLAMSMNAQLLHTTVAQGEIEGVEQNGLAHYKGIPFATPPVGDLRWKAPQPAQQWQGVYKADSFKDKPYQQSQGPARPGQPGVSEDCLYLNVLTPAKKAGEGLPVLVWIHGGGFNTGASWENNGEKFAQAGIVYAAITYRTNVFGFLSLPELSAESQKENGRAISGNYGLMDQIMALQWIHDNIAAFGGAPQKVTIMGESAGAISVSMLCQSPLTKGLFRGAISESGGNMAPEDNVRIDNNSIRNMAGSEQYGKDFINRIGMGKMKLKDLRKVDPEKFMGDPIAFGAGGALWPCYDGYVLKGDPYPMYQEGDYNDVNILMGTNSDEGSMFTGFLGGFKPAQYEQEITESFPTPEWQQKFRQMYPGNTDQEAFDAHSDIFREAAFAWPTYAWGNLQSQRTAEGKGQGKVYMFFFNHAKQNFFRNGQQTDRQYLTMHAGELGLTFGQLGGFGGAPNPSDEALSRLVQQYWINFIKTGDPNGGYLPLWPAYTKDSETVMNFRDGAFLTGIHNKAQLQLWEEYMKWRRVHKTIMKN
ncbi:MAG: carboxylesterase family protein [Bacteroidaceae bacterium]|nr:carboxylesterase family protein [Bacteroidaceae bacterium]